MASRKKPKVKAKARHPARKAKAPTSNNSQLPSGYIEVLEDIKERVRTARIQASLSVNRELIILYWEIGHLILKRQEAEGWGTKVIDRFSIDLNREFPDQKGFSARNLKYMRKFAESYHARKIVQQAAAQIPWFHNCTIHDKVQDTEQRQWYMRQFYLAYRDLPDLQQLVGEIPWGQNIVIMSQLKKGLEDLRS